MDADDRGSALPDLLSDGLDVVFVGINPSVFSAAQGHYFARRTNRFWPCFSRSRLSQRAREAMGLALLEPAHDRRLLDYGFGFTDAVKRATARAADLTLAELASGVPLLTAKNSSVTSRQSPASTASPPTGRCIAPSPVRSRIPASDRNRCASIARGCSSFPIQARQMRITRPPTRRSGTTSWRTT